MKSEIKENVERTNSDGNETGTQINSLEQKEEINIQPVQNEESKIQKSEERRRNVLENFKHSCMKENFPILTKEIDFQEVQEAQRVPKKLDPRRNTPRHIIITLPKIKDKERILKAAREKETVNYEGVPIRLSADFSKGTLQARRGWKEVFEVMKDKDLYPRLFYPAKLSFRMEGQIKCFPDKVNLKGLIITKPLLYEMLKGLT